MSITLTPPSVDIQLKSRSTRAKTRTSFFKTVWTKIQSAQTHKAEERILQMLQGMDDKTLLHCGYSENSIDLIRQGQFVRPS